MTAARHEFEGEQLTVSEIRKRVPALSDHTIRTHLAAGRRTTAAMLTYDPREACRRGGRIARARAEANGTAGTMFKRKGKTTA